MTTRVPTATCSGLRGPGSSTETAQLAAVLYYRQWCGLTARWETKVDKPYFSVTVVVEESCCCVVLDGELDAHSKGQAADALTQALLERPLRIEVDCARLTFLDSSGLHVFTKARAAARESGKVLVLTQVAGAPRRVIEVCGLTELLC